MSKTIPLGPLIKFGKERFLRNFCDNGEIYFNVPSSFKIPDLPKGQFDSKEFAENFFSHGKISIGSDPKLQDLNIRYVDFNLGRYSKYSKWSHMSCFYRLKIEELDENFQQRAFFDERMIDDFEADSLVAIYNPMAFLEKLETAMEAKNLEFFAGDIDYIDIETYHGEMGPLKKRNKIGDYDITYQSEFRLLCSNLNEQSGFTVNLGNLDGIAAFYKLDRTSLINLVTLNETGDELNFRLN